MGNYVRFPITNVEGDLVAQYRNPREKLYASLELNQVAFPKTGMVVSQTPLGEAFTADAPCENGMWVVGDKAAGAINPPANATDAPIGIVYTTEKEYDREHYGLQRFGRKIAGDYPRVGLLGIGDTVTTNCLQYSKSNFANEEALLTALKADLSKAANALYVVPGNNSDLADDSAKAVPEIVKAAPGSGAYARIVKFYTIPNGGIGVKYQMVRV
jgi:hypothetical protein